MVSQVHHEFDGIPPIGTVLVWDGQEFELVGSELHRRLDGQMTTLLVWLGECHHCRCSLVTRTPLAVRSINRRCDLHKRPGQRVGGGKRRRPFVVSVRLP